MKNKFIIELNEIKTQTELDKHIQKYILLVFNNDELGTLTYKKRWEIIYELLKEKASV